MEMKDFQNQTLGASFKLPVRPTVRQQLAYTSAAGFSPRVSMLERHWEGLKAIVADWSCDLLPDTAVNLDDITQPRAADVITWAGLQAAMHMSQLEDIPGNS